MMKIKTLIFTALFAVSLTGCFAVTNSPVSGLLVTATKSPVTATSNVKGSKTGSAKCVSIFGLIAAGDCSVEKAAENGNITKVHTVDSKNVSVLGIYASQTTIVTGE